MKRNAQRHADRREAEDSAKRLTKLIPKLVTLKLQLGQGSVGTTPEPGYVRHIMVNTAPALFLIPCSNRKCEPGSHDITADVLRALRAGEVTAAGSHRCEGLADGSDCGWLLNFTIVASYRD